VKYFEEYFVEDDVLFQISKQSNKPVMYIESTGLKDCGDDQKIEEVWNFYLDKCDIDVYNALRQFGKVYCYFSTEEQAKNAFEEWFPNYNDLLDEEKHFYFFQHLVVYSSGLNITND
jgi:hypothetical protein